MPLLGLYQTVERVRFVDGACVIPAGSVSWQDTVSVFIDGAVTVIVTGFDDGIAIVPVNENCAVNVPAVLYV